MHRLSFILPFCFILLLAACQQSEKRVEAPTAPQENSLPEWAGTYAGTLPCADCDGIETRLTLFRGMTFRLMTRDLGKADQLVEKRGNFTIDGARGIATLEGVASGPSQYQIGKNMVTQLDMGGEKIGGKQAMMYQLIRVPGSELASIRWSLTDLMGKEINRNPAYVMFDPDNGLVRGFGWCNPFRGSFEVESAGRINFGPIAGGAQVCADTTLETQFFNLFGAVDQYHLDGRTLTLFRVKEHPLAILRQAELRQVPQ